jgi:hypothetical protein
MKTWLIHLLHHPEQRRSDDDDAAIMYQLQLTPHILRDSQGFGQSGHLFDCVFCFFLCLAQVAFEIDPSFSAESACQSKARSLAEDVCKLTGSSNMKTCVGCFI